MDRIIRREPADWRHSVAFTGHRPQKLPFGFDEADPRCVDFKRRLCNSIEMMILEGYTHFISGGALGMDMYAAEAVLTLREQYPEITLEIAIPHDGQTAKWPQSLRNRAERIREEADVITWIAHEYTKRCLFDRNYYMVSHCSVLLACFDGQPGGTAQTIETAHRLGAADYGCAAGPPESRVIPHGIRPRQWLHLRRHRTTRRRILAHSYWKIG